MNEKEKLIQASKQAETVGALFILMNLAQRTELKTIERVEVGRAIINRAPEIGIPPFPHDQHTRLMYNVLDADSETMLEEIVQAAKASDLHPGELQEVLNLVLEKKGELTNGN